MREIKYKVWNEELEEMYTISKEKYLGSTGIVDPYVGHEKAVWMQFTGLTDVNSREIYEGDIVKLTVPDRHYTMQGNGYSDIMREDGFEFVGEVKFLHAMWFIKESLDGYPLIFDTDQTLEVIGNIYQHKHLLKENE